jgi:hypothetical protein
VLRANGYGTALFGKAHFTPTWEIGPAGSFDRWLTGLGFERFYGFLGGDFTQGVDLAAQHPDKLAELQRVFDAEARALPGNRPSLLADRTSVTYYAGQVRIPEPVTLGYASTSFELRARLQIPPGGAQGGGDLHRRGDVRVESVPA